MAVRYPQWSPGSLLLPVSRLSYGIWHDDSLRELNMTNLLWVAARNQKADVLSLSECHSYIKFCPLVLSWIPTHFFTISVEFSIFKASKQTKRPFPDMSCACMPIRVWNFPHREFISTGPRRIGSREINVLDYFASHETSIIYIRT